MNLLLTYPLPNEALLPRGAQRPKVTLGEAKHNYNSMGVGRANPSPCFTLLSSPALIWVGSWGSPSFPRTKATLQNANQSPCSRPPRAVWVSTLKPHNNPAREGIFFY